MRLPAEAVAALLLPWYDRAGRKHLPWKQDPTPYRVWVSEVMLQQTQVATVIPYFQRFVADFPDLPALAAAPLDAVLNRWTGLGYYARGRNLHRAAHIVMQTHGGRLPEDLDALAALPGIGRSTAGAILALAHGRRHVILDGNVKRVLTRLYAVEGWPGRSAVARRLWDLAEHHTPGRRIADYTQALMDLGATLCTRKRPECGACPLADDCRARAAGTQTRYPTPKPTRQLPVRTTAFLLLRDGDGRILLQRRPPAGLWGGLWTFPECPVDTDPAAWCTRALGLAAQPQADLPGVRHTFSHFHLDITPRLLRLDNPTARVMEGPDLVWYKKGQSAPGGLPAPIVRLLDQLDTDPGANP